MSKVWFITGSAHGFGRNFAEAALTRGDKVVATARNSDRLQGLATAYGDLVLPLELDVTDKAAVFECVTQAKEHFGRLDVVVNNAATGVFGTVEELTEQHLRNDLETNLFGALWVIQAALPHLREQGSGHIIQMSSISGVVALPLAAAYQISKFAVEALNDGLAQEVAGFGIKVTIVEPGSFDTNGTGVFTEANPAYDEVRRSFFEMMKKQEVGDPTTAAHALLQVVDAENPPLRVFFGPQGHQLIQQVYADRLQTWADWKDLSLEAHGNLGRDLGNPQAERFGV